MPSGGARPGAGRPKGKKTAEQVERDRVSMMMQMRRYKVANRIFNAQLALAEGCTYVYEVIETGEGKSKKSEHVLVTDPDRIKAFLDESNGDTGAMTADGRYMFITTEKPDGKMIADIFDRAFGKPMQAIEVTHTPDADTREMPDDDIDSELATLRDAERAASERERASSGEAEKTSVN